MTHRDLIRSGAVPDPWGWVIVAVLCVVARAGQAALVSGCGPRTRPLPHELRHALTGDPNAGH